MPIDYVPSLPPVPAGMSVSDISVLREQLQEDTLQLLLKYVANRTGVVVRPEDYGAVGDGVHDDLLAFQLATSQLITAGGGSLILAPGAIYRLTGEWVIGFKCVSSDEVVFSTGYALASCPSFSAPNLALARAVPYISIVGNNSTIWADWTGSPGRAAIYYGISTSDGKQNTYNGSIKDLVIIGKEGMTGSPPVLASVDATMPLPGTNYQVGVFAALAPIKIERVYVREMARGFVLTDCYWSRLQDCQVHHCGTGFTFLQANATRTINLLAVSCRSIGYVTTGQQAAFQDLHTENCAVSLYCTASDNIKISDCYWENVQASDTDWAVKIGDSTNALQNQVISLTMNDIHLYQAYGKSIRFHSATRTVLNNVRSYTNGAILNNAFCQVMVVGYPLDFDLAGGDATSRARLLQIGSGVPLKLSGLSAGEIAGLALEPGLLVFNLTTNKLNLCNGVAWEVVTSV